ncbi:serine/threonine-protein kinase BIK1-like [Panicum virgatum]|uniref:serine/threonine-protein kinase BIK1-like n=1 Tax=Panicum virgatum TaxID=38727 RepID=UPI0019D549D3|nr:serine/threonine-protein kinase BIK1-like [Panicum virgatum]
MNPGLVRQFHSIQRPQGAPRPTIRVRQPRSPPSLRRAAAAAAPRPSGSDVAASAGLKSFSMNDLRAATKNFGSNSYLGEGGFGCVYKGWMDEATLAPTKPAVGRMVAVKKLKKESFQGHREWLAEVTYPGELHHENLVKLVGYCSDPDSNKLLVYEYMLRGSLENHLLRRGTWCGGRGRDGARTAGEDAAACARAAGQTTAACARAPGTSAHGRRERGATATAGEDGRRLRAANFGPDSGSRCLQAEI